MEWRRADGLTLPADVVQSGNNLIIAQVQSSDAGTYICSVENLAGRAENTTVLNVFSKSGLCNIQKEFLSIIRERVCI